MSSGNPPRHPRVALRRGDDWTVWRPDQDWRRELRGAGGGRQPQPLVHLSSPGDGGATLAVTFRCPFAEERGEGEGDDDDDDPAGGRMTLRFNDEVAPIDRWSYDSWLTVLAHAACRVDKLQRFEERQPPERIRAFYRRCFGSADARSKWDSLNAAGMKIRFCPPTDREAGADDDEDPPDRRAQRAILLPRLLGPLSLRLGKMIEKREKRGPGGNGGAAADDPFFPLAPFFPPDSTAVALATSIDESLARLSVRDEEGAEGGSGSSSEDDEEEEEAAKKE
jgi:hypothetical protein